MADEVDNVFDTEGNKILPRALTRLLMKKLGYPLKYFVDNLELLRAVRDAVKGKLIKIVCDNTSYLRASCSLF